MISYVYEYYLLSLQYYQIIYSLMFNIQIETCQRYFTPTLKTSFQMPKSYLQITHYKSDFEHVLCAADLYEE